MRIAAMVWMALVIATGGCSDGGMAPPGPVEPSAPICGNAVLETGEICDDGNTADSDGCDSNCTPTACGNGVRSINEGCDDGDLFSGDGCDSNCTVTGCGNGVRSGELCDDGNAISGDGCDNNCRPTGCGSGVITAGEVCDDGNLVSGDGCDSNCTPTGCGNSIRTGSEKCDDGNDTEGDGCDSNCTFSACGNGIAGGAEECDDANTTNGDGCDSNCTVTACGNGIATAPEPCDDGNDTEGDGCDSNCTVTACGNGIVAAPELCDDANLVDGDGCDSNCTITACGNGIATGAEECDDGDAMNGDGCDNNCTVTACGNGIATTPEQCDDGNHVSGDGCDANCKITACGNGVVTGAEECDDGNTNNTDGCTNACILQICGDGQLDAPETCDDGNLVNGDGCDANCTVTACGNGIVTAGEACDDGNQTSFDGCSSLCVIEPLEIEPNEDGTISSGAPGITGNDFAIANADANGAITSTVTIRASISPVGDEDVVKLTNTSNQMRLLVVNTWHPALGIGSSCGTSIDTGLRLRDASGATLVSNDDRAAGDRCAAVAYLIEPGATVYAHVMESGDNSKIAAYLLVVSFLQHSCGNGAIGSSAEQCDDGNTIGGDGCSATCQVELTAEVEPNNTFSEAAANPLQVTGDVTIRGIIGSSAEVDMYRLVVTAPTVIRFETFRTIYDCSGSSVLRLYDAAGMELVADLEGLGVGLCSAIVFLLPAGTYFIRVHDFSAVGTPYFLTIDYVLDRGTESEPANTSGVNDTTAIASVNLLGGRDVVVFGDHTLVSDVDVYAITVPGGVRIRAELIEGDRAVKTCESGITSRLTMFAQTGVQLADDFSSGRGGCSLIDGTGAQPLHPPAGNFHSTPQTFYLMVREGSFSPASSFTYRLQLSIR